MLHLRTHMSATPLFRGAVAASTILAGVFASGCTRSDAYSTPSSTRMMLPDEARQFDFWLGTWDVLWRQLDANGSYQDGGRTVNRLHGVLGGKALLEFATGVAPEDGYLTQGFSIRYYDTGKQKWVMAESWPRPDAVSLSPRKGVFRHGRVELFQEGTGNDGATVLTRYTFSDITPETFRWDNAASWDSGQSWSTGSIAEFTRRAEPEPLPAVDRNYLTYESGGLCTDQRARGLDHIVGQWTGTVAWTHGVGEVAWDARMEAGRVLDGCGIFQRTWYAGRDGDGREQVSLLLWVPRREAWLVLSLDDRPDTGFELLAGASGTEGAHRLTEHTPAGAQPRAVWKGIDLPASTADTLQYALLESRDHGKLWESVAQFRLTRPR